MCLTLENRADVRSIKCLHVKITAKGTLARTVLIMCVILIVRCGKLFNQVLALLCAVLYQH